MKFEIEILDGEYQLVVDAEAAGGGVIRGADNPDDLYGYMGFNWKPVIGVKWDVYGSVVELTGEQLFGVAERYQDEIQASITEAFVEYAREYAEDAALDAVDREFCGDY